MIRKQWGKVENKIAKTGKVDAALFDGNKSYLFRDDEYLVYSKEQIKGQKLAEPDYPKSIKNSNELFLPPEWDRVDAAFRKNNQNYFFNNHTKTFVVIQGNKIVKQESIKDYWGKQETPINSFVNLPEDKRLVDAAFMLGEETYLINESFFIKYTNNDYDLIALGYPKEHNLYNLLEDLQFKKNKKTYQRARIFSAYNVDSDLYFFTADNKGVKKYKLTNKNLTQEELSDGEESTAAGFSINNVTYQFRTVTTDSDEIKQQLFISNSNTPINLKIQIRAAFISTDNTVYLFSKQDYISFPLSETPAETIEQQIEKWDENKKPIANQWGKERNNITELGTIDAAFCQDNKMYLFSGNQYFIYSNDEGKIDEGYPKTLENNQEGLPKWHRIDAVLTTGENNKKYFFNNEENGGIFVESDKLNNRLKIQETWGIIHNNFTETGIIDAAFSNNNYLILFSGNQYIRYPLSENLKFVETGDPQTFADKDKETIKNTFRYDYEIVRLTTSTAYKLTCIIHERRKKLKKA